MTYYDPTRVEAINWQNGIWTSHGKVRISYCVGGWHVCKCGFGGSW